MKILYINHYAGSPEYGMEFRPYHLAKEWQKNGHESLIIGADFSHLRRKNPEKTGYSQINGVNYFWIKSKKYFGNGVGRVLNIFGFTSRLFLKRKEILKHISPDVVVASSTHPFDIFPAWWIARKAKAKLAFEIHDLWPLSLTELGGMSKFHPFVMMVAIGEYFAYKLPDKIISILPNTLEHAKKFDVKPENFIAIPNGIVASDWDNTTSLPESHAKIISDLKSQEKFLVGYAGAHGVANSLTTLIDAAEDLQKTNIHIVLVGGGQEKQNLQNYVKTKNIQNITFLDGISKESIPVFLNEMDVLAICWQKQRLYKYGVSANKIFDYMMAAKPIINALDSKNDPISMSNCGYTIKPECPNTLKNTIKEISTLPKKDLEIMGEKGRAYVLKNHEYSYLAKNFIEALNN